MHPPYEKCRKCDNKVDMIYIEQYIKKLCSECLIKEKLNLANKEATK